MGDTFPFLSIGRRLREKGHEVALAASGYFQEKTEAAGLDFHSTFTREEYLQFVDAQCRWTPKESLEGMFRVMIQQMPRVHEIIEKACRSNTVVVAQGYAIGARIAQEVLDVPTITVHVQPLCFRSTIDMAGVPRWIPGFVVRFFDRLVDRVVDKRLGPEVNAFRSRFGLPPCRGIIKSWWNSPDRVLGLFPEWLDAPRSDWPPNSTAVGFPTSPSDRIEEPEDELATFMESGEPPIVFSQSSVTTDEEYLNASVEATTRLGMRAVLISPYTDDGESNDRVHRTRFVPLRWLLPRAALHVHHGGVGTIAATLEAGIPQLTVPMSNDQPDNVNRLSRLGVSAILTRKRYRPARIVKAIQRLLSSTEVQANCRRYGDRMKSDDGLEAAAMEIETFARTSRTTLSGSTKLGERGLRPDGLG